MKPKITVFIYDAGYKDSAPILESLVNQTILSELEVIWVEFHDKIFKDVYKYDFVKKVTLNFPQSRLYHVGYCYNVGLMLANGELFTVMDPCLWLPENCMEKLYEVHRNEEYAFTYNLEFHGGDKENRYMLTKKYVKDVFNTLSLSIPNGKLKKSNYGCISTMRTNCLREINGYDIYLSDKHMTDRIEVSLALARAQHKYPMKIIPIEPMVYHPWHPRYSDPKEDKSFKWHHKCYKKVINKKSLIKAKRGLDYVTNNIVKVSEDEFETKFKIEDKDSQ